MLLLTLVQRRAILPAARREWSEALLALNPRESPGNVMAVFKVLDMLLGVTFLHLL